MGYSELRDAFRRGRDALVLAFEARKYAATVHDEAQMLRRSNDLWMAPGLAAGHEFLDTLPHDIETRTVLFARHLARPS